MIDPTLRPSAGFAAEKRLLAWYDANKRALPWRGSSDPWAVWVSETMLQQTRVETVLDYYGPFMKRFPTPAALAKAPLDDALKAWEGLGYYSRIRNLKSAAERVAASGAYPRTATQWALLPGVGPYTAAALASIVAGEPEPVADGNVVRVVARLRAERLDPHDPRDRAASADWLRPALLRTGDPARFNQAVMELGETVCIPGPPRCEACPLAGACRGRATGRPDDFPKKRPPKELPERRFAAFVVRDAKGRPLLFRRPADGLLAGLWELPMVAVRHSPSVADARRALDSLGLAADELRPLGDIRHDFTHFRQILHLWDAVGGPRPSVRRADRRYADPATLPVATASRRALEFASAARSAH